MGHDCLMHGGGIRPTGVVIMKVELTNCFEILGRTTTITCGVGASNKADATKSFLQAFIECSHDIKVVATGYCEVGAVNKTFTGVT